jgi:hypothetical protein
MIQAQHIDTLQVGPHALDPPVKPLLGHSLPVVDGVAPQLTCLAVVIRRHSRDPSRAAVIVQLKQFRVGPNVDTVVRNVVGQVAAEHDPTPRCRPVESRPLPVEQELKEALVAALFGERPGDTTQCRRLPPTDLVVPFVPGRVSMNSLQGREQHPVLEPHASVGMLDERLELLPDRHRGGAGKASPGETGATVFVLGHLRVVDAKIGLFRLKFGRCRLQQSRLNQAFGGSRRTPIASRRVIRPGPSVRAARPARRAYPPRLPNPESEPRTVRGHQHRRGRGGCSGVRALRPCVDLPSALRSVS